MSRKQKRVRKVTSLRRGESLLVQLPGKGRVAVYGPPGVSVAIQKRSTVDAHAVRST